MALKDPDVSKPLKKRLGKFYREGEEERLAREWQKNGIPADQQRQRGILSPVVSEEQAAPPPADEGAPPPPL